MSDVLHPAAKNENGNFVDVFKAVRHHAYYCPSCDGEMVPRQGKKLTWHFGHKWQSCNGERVHEAFKHAIHQRLFDLIDASLDTQVAFRCTYCHQNHHGPLLKRLGVTGIRVELPLGKVRPDLALLGVDGAVVGAIEIVDKHYPELQAMEYYRNKGITAFTFRARNKDAHTRLEMVERGGPFLEGLVTEQICPLYKREQRLTPSVELCSVQPPMRAFAPYWTPYGAGLTQCLGIEQVEPWPTRKAPLPSGAPLTSLESLPGGATIGKPLVGPKLGVGRCRPI